MPNEFFYESINPNANITVYIGGLAICNYNKRRKTWETIFLRHVTDHNLKLSVYKIIDGKEAEIANYDAIKPEEKISIKADDAADFSSEFRTPGFNYQSYSDKRNLGWCIDFASERMHGARKINFKKEKPVTCLSIKDSIFYTARHAEGKYEIKNQSWDVGHWLAADIAGEDELKIEFGVEKDKSLRIRLEKNIKYIVVFNNSCAEEDEQCLMTNDFNYYYDLVEEEPIDVIPPPRITNSFGKDVKKMTRKVFKGLISKRVACECAVCSQIELNSLFDLA